MRNICPIVILLVLSLLSSCSSDIEGAEDVYGEIIGSVNDYTTGEPVSSVNVTLSPGGKSTVTGSDGRFEFVNVKPDKYSITISKDGYSPTTKEYSVASGESVEAHLLIERIPAQITSDKSVLDFGEDLTTLSFTLVNRAYSDMRFAIEKGDCSWITVDPEVDVLAYAKTATIIVKIDRSLLASGENNAIIVVKSLSGGGNTEIKVKAIGEYRAKSAVNTLEADNINHSSARLNGEIINEGTPSYTERGFMWNTSATVNDNSRIGRLSVAINSESKFSCEISNLNATATYYARAYVIQNGEFIYGNIVTFSMSNSPTNISTSEASEITATTARLNASISNAGIPAYTERGFCLTTDGSTPSIASQRFPVSGTGTGAYTLVVTGLSYPTLYTVRAYAIQSGQPVYGNTISFTTQNVPTVVNASSASEVTSTSAKLNGVIANEGSPAYTERGFCVDNYGSPTINSGRYPVAGTGKGAFALVLKNLSYPQTYYYRAYAIQGGAPVYSDAIQSFSTKFIEASVNTNAATNVTDNSARLNGTVSEVGDPVYSQRGFCYSYTSSMPTTSDGNIVEYNNLKGAYYKEITGLLGGKTYYVRAYVVQDGKTIYGNTVTFTTVAPPVVYTAPVTNIKGNDAGMGIILSYSATFNGYIESTGTPAYTERGFVYDSTSQPRVGSGTKVTVSGNGTGAYSKNVTNLNTYKTYYVRAYVKTSSGYVYGDDVSFETY